VLICLSSDDVEEGKIQLNKGKSYFSARCWSSDKVLVARNNVRVKLGDLCHVQACHDIKYGTRIHVLPFDDSIEGLSGNLFDVFLKVGICFRFFLIGVKWFLPSTALFPGSIPTCPER
jgi:transitional endoplasmic reticulum ATPase